MTGAIKKLGEWQALSPKNQWTIDSIMADGVMLTLRNGDSRTTHVLTNLEMRESKLDLLLLTVEDGIELLRGAA